MGYCALLHGPRSPFAGTGRAPWARYVLAGHGLQRLPSNTLPGLHARSSWFGSAEDGGGDPAPACWPPEEPLPGASPLPAAGAAAAAAAGLVHALAPRSEVVPCAHGLHSCMPARATGETRFYGTEFERWGGAADPPTARYVLAGHGWHWLPSNTLPGLQARSSWVAGEEGLIAGWCSIQNSSSGLSADRSPDAAAAPESAPW